MAIILCGANRVSIPEIENSINEEAIIEKEKEEVEKEKIIVHVTGCVENEGIVELEEGARIADAIENAGGATLDADMGKINLAYKLKDGQKIYVPSNIEKEEISLVTDEGEGVQDAQGKTSGKVNINTATQTELETLSGIGPSMAQKIIEYRNKNGKFTDTEDIKNVPGIGDAKYSAIKDDIEI